MKKILIILLMLVVIPCLGFSQEEDDFGDEFDDQFYDIVDDKVLFETDERLSLSDMVFRDFLGTRFNDQIQFQIKIFKERKLYNIFGLEIMEGVNYFELNQLLKFNNQ